MKYKISSESHLSSTAKDYLDFAVIRWHYMESFKQSLNFIVSFCKLHYINLNIFIYRIIAIQYEINKCTCGLRRVCK